MSEKKESNKKSPQGGGTPQRQPGQLMWDAGIYYFADGFTYESTKPAVNWIIEKKILLGYV